MGTSIPQGTVTDIQTLIDGKAYPPTHDYDLATLTPRGPLADRLRLIEGMSPTFFEGDRFLDVGCSKGFFLQYSSAATKQGVEPDSDAVEVCKLLDLPVYSGQFSGYAKSHPDVVFDRIFIGNAYHYLFRDEEWRWIDRLAEMSDGLVLVEGPNEHCRDVMPDIEGRFYESDFLAGMEKHFKLIGRIPTCDYTPDRYFWLFERQDLLHTLPHKRYREYLAKVYTKMSERLHGSVVEVCCRHEDRGTITPEYIPNELILVDRDKRRPGLNMDVTEELPDADNLISTAILHHLPVSEWESFFRVADKHIKGLLIIAGPSNDRTELFGDHATLISPELVANHCHPWRVIHSERVGMNEPYCEWMIVCSR